MGWPPYSPVLTHCDFLMCRVSKRCDIIAIFQNTSELKQHISAVCKTILIVMLVWVSENFTVRLRLIVFTDGSRYIENIVI